MSISINSLDHDFKDFYFSNLSLNNSLSLIDNPKPFFLDNPSKCWKTLLFLFFLLVVVLLAYVYIKKCKMQKN